MISATRVSAIDFGQLLVRHFCVVLDQVFFKRYFCFLNCDLVQGKIDPEYNTTLPFQQNFHYIEVTKLINCGIAITLYYKSILKV